jgi:outer membrane protein assembly factor BamD
MKRALSFAILLAACADTGTGEHAVTYQVTAKQNYEKGVRELKDENYPEAMKYFVFLKQKFPFSKFAVLAELRIADTQFERGHFLEAIDQYKLFGRSHPTHEFVEDGYVGFKICESYYKQIPEDFFLLPPAFEKDQSATKDAVREIDAFLEKWPKSKYAEQAKKMRGEAVRSLAAAELYVARFYWKRSKYRATAWRLEGMLKEYSGSPYESEALLLLGRAYEKLGEKDKARDAYAKVVEKHPGSGEVGEAKSRIHELPATPRPPAPKPAPKGQSDKPGGEAEQAPEQE